MKLLNLENQNSALLRASHQMSRNVAHSQLIGCTGGCDRGANAMEFRDKTWARSLSTVLPLPLIKQPTLCRDQPNPVARVKLIRARSKGWDFFLYYLEPWTFLIQIVIVITYRYLSSACSLLSERSVHTLLSHHGMPSPHFATASCLDEKEN